MDTHDLPKQTLPSIATRTWLIMAALAITGQIAWAVENTWFNTFVFDQLTPDPRPVAWMVAASAITATLTTLVMGTLSDRTRALGTAPTIYFIWLHPVGAVHDPFPDHSLHPLDQCCRGAGGFRDSLMTFFGSTANDAAFNAWTADVATTPTHGRVEGGAKFERCPCTDRGAGGWQAL